MPHSYVDFVVVCQHLLDLILLICLQSKYYNGCIWGSLLQQVLLPDDPVGSLGVHSPVRVDLPGTGLVVGPLDLIDVDLPAVALRPAGGGVDGADLAVHGHFKERIVPLAALELVADTGNTESPVFRMQCQDIVQGQRHVLVVVLDDLPFRFLALRQRTPLLRAVEPQHLRDVPPIVQRLQEVYGMVDVLDKLVSEETFPQLAFVGIGTGSIREGDIDSGQLLHQLHSLLDVGGVVTVVVGVQEQGTVSNHSELAVCLTLEVITPKQGSDTGIERPNQYDLLPILEPIDLIEVGHCLLDVLRPLEVDMLVPILDGFAIAHKTAPVTALDDHLGPIVEVPSAIEAENASQVSDIRGPVDRRPRIDEVILGDELVALVETTGQVLLHAPPEVDLLEVDQQFVGHRGEVQRVGDGGVDGVGRTVHAHRPRLHVELHLPEEGQPQRPSEQQEQAEGPQMEMDLHLVI